ncbi:MAG TPA: zinc-ribbon and DUF3426 domain-containing protein [Pseudomonadales bacterium]
MLSFLTQCPHCLTSFRVTGKQLDAAEGLVRCGACLGIFSAEANRITVKPTPDEVAAAEAHADIEDEDTDLEIDVAPVVLPEFDEPDDSEETAGLVEIDEREEDTELDEFDDESENERDDELDEELDEPENELDDALDERHHPLDADVIPARRQYGQLAAALRPSPDFEASDNDDLPGSRDFDIPLGDLNLDIDDEDDNSIGDGHGEHDAGYEHDDEPDDEAGALDDEYAPEDDEPEDVEDAAGGIETDDDHYAAPRIDAIDARTSSNERLIDVVYEEYIDEDDAEAEQTDDDEPSEEFEPEFTLDDEDDPPHANATPFIGPEATADEEYDDYEEHDTDIEPEPLRPAHTGMRSASDKATLRHYLADIEDDDALDPLDDDDALDAFDEPVLLETAPRRSRAAGFALLLANLSLAVLLGWQYADANIESLSRSASFAPLMPFACRLLDCPAPERAQPDQFVSEQLLVRSHPRYAQALEVSLVFRNDAADAQPFPALELGFLDTSNRMVANRLFQPAEYLPPELQTSEMPAQSSFQVTLELVDPGSDAVNYTLAFRKP